MFFPPFARSFLCASSVPFFFPPLPDWLMFYPRVLLPFPSSDACLFSFVSWIPFHEPFFRNFSLLPPDGPIRSSLSVFGFTARFQNFSLRFPPPFPCCLSRSLLPHVTPFSFHSESLWVPPSVPPLNFPRPRQIGASSPRSAPFFFTIFLAVLFFRSRPSVTSSILLLLPSYTLSVGLLTEHIRAIFDLIFYHISVDFTLRSK